MSNELGPDSTVRELFEAIAVDKGVNLVPVAISKAEDEVARLAIFITGEQEDARLLFANLMAYVDQLHAAAEQHAANLEAEDEPAIIVP